MIVLFLAGAALVAVTVLIHAGGMALVLQKFFRKNSRFPVRPWPTAWLLIRLTWFLLFIHAVEISVWALFYFWWECFPDVETAFYFSGVSYATIGYGDVVLPERWRMLGPVQGLTGILMCGLSTSVFVAILSRKFFPRLTSGTP